MVYAAPDVKKNRAARARNWGVGIVSNLDEPVISKISGFHLFMRVVIGRLLGVDNDVTIVIGRARIIAPNVSFANLPVGIIAPRGQFRVVPKYLADFEDACRSAPIAFLFSQSWLILTSQAHSPGQTILAEQNRKGAAGGVPIASVGSLEQLKGPMDGVPIGRKSK